MKKSTLRIIIPIASTVFIVIGTYLAIQIAKGYRPTKTGTITGTGLLAANSFPNAAEVYLNGKLTTATDDTLSLTPQEYDVTIKKEGYLPWQKKITIQKELVSQTNATLFRAVPGLTPLTLSGASNINPSPDGQKIAFAVDDASNPSKNGLYVLDLSGNLPFSSTKEPKLIARNYNGYYFSKALLLWSPQSNQLLAHFSSEDSTEVSNYLLSPDSFNEVSTLPDISIRLPVILMQWEEEIVTKETRELTALPDELESIATQSAVNVYFSPNQKRVLYTSTEYLELPEGLLKTPPSTSSQPENRKLEPGGIYSYDLVEDKNYRIGSMALDDQTPQKHTFTTQSYQQIPNNADKVASTPGNIVMEPFNRLQDPKSFYQTRTNFLVHYSPIHLGSLQWYPDSNHLIMVDAGKIDILEYDAQNRLTVYSGPFENGFTYPWPDGSKLIITTNLNPNSDIPSLNLYAVDIR